MTFVSSERAQGAERLWRLKIALESASPSTAVQYTKLLHDNDYRVSICRYASQSSNPMVRQLGIELLRMDASPQNATLAQNVQASANELRLNRDVIETLLFQQQSAAVVNDSKRTGFPTYLAAGITLLVSVAIVIAANFKDSLYQWLAHETQVQGSQVGEQHWTADHTWILKGVVIFEPGARLHIDAGTTIVGTPGSALVISRGAQVFARGTASAPIVFTSAQAVGQRQRGDWGGVVMLGSAPVNKPDAHIEGIPADNPYGRFGGNDATSACGVLEYVRIEYAGFEAFKDNELNGLTLGGCGSDTLIRNIQVHRSLDDGIEIFGGTVDLKNVVITGAADDSLDWDYGWSGRVQFLIAQQYADEADNAFEGDNLKAAPDATPRSRPVMYNVTLISPANTSRYQRGVTLRNGTAGEFHNVIMTGFGNDTIDLQGAETIKNIKNHQLVFSDFLIQSQHAGKTGKWFEDESMENDDNGFDEARFFQDAQLHFTWQSAVVLPVEAHSESNPVFTPMVSEANSSSFAHIPEDEFWDKGANFLGAIRPGSAHAWWQGWTAYSVN